MNTFWIICLIAALIICVVAIAMIVTAFGIRKEQKDYMDGKDIRHWFMLLPLVFLFSCAATNKTHYNRIHGLSKTGTYTIKTRHGNVTTFKEVGRTYRVLSDTLKPNDTIVINVIKIK